MLSNPRWGEGIEAGHIILLSKCQQPQNRDNRKGGYNVSENDTLRGGKQMMKEGMSLLIHVHSLTGYLSPSGPQNIPKKRN